MIKSLLPAYVIGSSQIPRDMSTHIVDLSLVASANRNGVVFTDPSGEIFWVNEGFSTLTGFSFEDALGKTPIQLCAGELTERARLREMVDLFNRGLGFEVEVLFYRKDGSSFWGRVKGQSVLNDGGEVVQYFSIIENITVEKNNAEALRLSELEAKKQIEDAMRAKDMFLANMSHEIRTPMNAILGLTRQLQKTSMNAQQQHFLGAIGSAAGNLLVIVNDILDFSKLEAGKLSIEDIGFDLKDLLNKAGQVLGLKAEEAGLVLDVFVDPKIAPVLKGDPFRINQILMNLLGNAIKFTKRGRVDLRCLVMQTTGEEQVLKISVSDTGKGMDEKYISNIFSKFSQEDESIARSYGGTGLGMSIVKQLLDLMHGTIEVNSVKDIGTDITIMLTFPIGKSEDVPLRICRSENPDALAGKRILLVEDNEMNRLVAVTLLNEYGAHVTEATNGLESVRLLKNETFDLVLMDMQMPVMDGIEATRIIRKEVNATIPIVALTANAMKGEMEKCLAAGMNDFVSKPFEESHFIEMVTRWSGGEYKPGPIEMHAVKEERLYNLDELFKLSGRDKHLVDTMLQMFFEHAPAAIAEIRLAAQAGDLKGIRHAAHRIRSSYRQLGMESMADTLQTIELADWTVTPLTQLSAMLDDLESSTGKVIDELRKDLRLHKRAV